MTSDKFIDALSKCLGVAAGYKALGFEFVPAPDSVRDGILTRTYIREPVGDTPRINATFFDELRTGLSHIVITSEPRDELFDYSSPSPVPKGNIPEILGDYLLCVEQGMRYPCEMLELAKSMLEPPKH